MGSRIENVPSTYLLSAEGCLSSSGDPRAVGHWAQFNRREKAKASPRHLISTPPVAHLRRGWCHSVGIGELCCWGRRLTVHLPTSADLKSPESMVSPQPSPSAAVPTKEKWPVTFVRVGCVAQSLAVGSLHLSQWVKHHRYIYKRDGVEGGFVLLQHGKTDRKMSHVRIPFSKNYL